MAIDPTEIQLTAEQRRYIAELAEKMGKPWPELLDELVPGSLPENGNLGETAYDVAARLGLLALSDAGPSDLATNPAHLEGFGKRDRRTRSD